MNQLLERLRIGAEQLAFLLPPILAALVLLVAGYLLARQVQRWVDATLLRLNFKAVADAGGITEAVERTGKRLDPGSAVAKLAFWLVMLVVILLASTALGLESINEMFGAMIGFLPTLIAALVIVVLSVIMGEFVRVVLLASAGAVAGVPTLAKLAKATVVLIGVFMALTQVGVAPEIVTTAFTLILGAVALAAGLAFGLGNRDLAGELTRKWYEEGQRRNRRAADRVPPPAAPPPVG
ncbi:MAG: mechanosensitive ion channel family protein [Gemmatimonadales bacterium]